MAHKKGVGSSKNGRESESKRLGVKLFGGEFAKAGNIIVRQRGTTHHPGDNAGIGKDHTIYALIDGIVVFRKSKNNRSYISVKRLATEPAKVDAEKVIAGEVGDTEIDTVELTFSDMKSEVETVEAEAETVEAEVETAEAEVEEATVEVETAEAAVETEVMAVESTVEKVETTVTETEDK